MGYLEVGIDQTTGAGEITGSGTAYYLPVFTGTTVIANSMVYQDTATGSALVIAPTAVSSGAKTAFTVANSSNTGQTASTNISGFVYDGGSRQWATGAIATQYESYFSAAIYTAVGASTITNAYGMYVEAPTASTNVTITNNYSAGFNSNVYIGGKVELGTTTVASPTSGDIYYTGATSTGFNFYSNDGTFTGDAFRISSALVTLGTYFNSTSAFIYTFTNSNLQFGTNNGAAAQTISTSGAFTFAPYATSSGNTRSFQFTSPSRTNNTASTESTQFNITSGSIQFATGALTTQRHVRILNPTYTAVGASTITSAYTFYVDAPTASTNVTITNNYSAGFAGGNGIQIQTGSIGNQGLVLRDTVGDSTQAAIYGGVTPAAGNSAIRMSLGNTYINGSSGSAVYFQINEATAGYVTAGSWRMAPPATSGGGILPIFDWRPSTMSGYTASTNTPMFKIASTTMTFATGALTTWYASYFQTTTINFVASSTVTNAYGLFVEAPTAAGNATITNNYALGLLAGTGTMYFGNLQGSTSRTAIYLEQSSPSTTNFALSSNGSGSTILNSTTTTLLSIGAGNRATINSTATSFVNHQTFDINASTNASSGAVVGLTITQASNTGQTASTEIPGFKMLGGSRTWATGDFTTQRETYFSTTTWAANASSTITNGYAFYIEAPTTGINMIVTNLFSLGLSGSMRMVTGRILENQGADVASANNLILGTDGNTFEITGTTQINLISNISWQNGSKITLLFTSNPVVKHNQVTSGTNITIQLAGAADFSATAGDSLSLVLSEIGGVQAWREISRAVI